MSENKYYLPHQPRLFIRLMWLDEIGRKIHPCHSIVAAFLEPHFNGYETTAAHRIEIPATPCISSSPFRPWAIDCVGTKLSICGSDSSHAHIDGAWMCPSTGVPVGSAALSHDASHRVLSTHSDGIIRIDGECIFNLGVTGQSVAKWIDDSLIAVVTSKGGRCYLIDSSSRYIVADWGNFLYPCDIAVGLKGEQLLIADTLNRRVVEIRPATGSRRIVIEDIYARSLCISDGTGHVMVSDGLTGTIRIFTTDFQELHSWRISLPEASSSIRGLAISEDKCLLVCDSVSSCIWRFPPMWQ